MLADYNCLCAYKIGFKLLLAVLKKHLDDFLLVVIQLI